MPGSTPPRFPLGDEVDRLSSQRDPLEFLRKVKKRGCAWCYIFDGKSGRREGALDCNRAWIKER